MRMRSSSMSPSSLLLLLGSLSLSDAAGVSKRALSVPATLPGAWRYQGCYVDVDRSLSEATYTDTANMTATNCISFCGNRGFQYAGTEYSQECWCGSSLAAAASKAADGDCSDACTGNYTQACGGGNRLSLFYSSQPVGPQPNPGVNGWNYMGCYAEGNTGRALSYTVGSIPGANMTVALCTSACKSAGYTLSGVEYSGECYCDNKLQNGGGPATSGCNMLCNGNQTEPCGGPNRLNLYDYQMQSPVSSSSASTQQPLSASTSSTSSTSPVAVSSSSDTVSRSTIDSTSSAAGSTTAASSTSPVPVSSSSSTTSSTGSSATGFPAGWTSQGCWVDGAQGRVLQYQVPNTQTSLTPQTCAAACHDAGYIVSGAEYANECYCGNGFQNNATKATSSDCNMACAGDSKQVCGAGNRLSVVSKGVPAAILPPAPIQQVGSWTYQGCFTDNVNNMRTFANEIVIANMTPSLCLDSCAAYGYMAGGIEYGDECYCGDPSNIGTNGVTKQPESDCTMTCPGNSSAICGNGNRLTTYFWTGTTPLYSWNFPTGAAAGEYSFLIGGLTIPLMASESVTGKVSFVSKFGTGPANDSGAYELDLTLANDFSKAWRQLHVKTDVFCAAGLVLPDKAGRQLTIGGWSADSLSGLRLYWPDGSPGVWGTNDWQENVDEVSLQVGRWYPSAIVMANGSILVVGGEDGSNGAAVPSLELLPDTGTAPLYMDWLARTDPNNLYPFLAVLPSGGIFVQYWNEARILDENTFATTKTLPNAPGHISVDTGGRTYPLEGAAVLLPQKYPYTDHLGILICGGSTPYQGVALDNCVTTYPEDAAPTWTLERMPSPRVMACMNALPDGTYLLINGAQQGQAGFGLATKPNLNAVLYDPAKPVGSRMTVLANTTIARLYHSEAVTLLDGRVLVSGSNPQDNVHPEEYRVEVFTPPYLLTGKPRPSFTVASKDWAYGAAGIGFTLGSAPVNGAITVTLLGAVFSTHGNGMGNRMLMPKFSCAGTKCTVDAPPNAHVSPPGWYQMFVMDGGIPAVGVYVRIGGDPGALGNWPDYPDFKLPGV